jgi:prepilin-type N-terminal cleavage/methylation domain-containing protein
MSPVTAHTISRRGRLAFTLIELLVAVAVLLLLIAFVGALVNNAASVTAMADKRMDAESQARAIFDRMAIDFAQIVKRPDVDCFLKDGGSTPQTGNDQIAFYSEVPGYYSVSGSRSPVSLVAYRVSAAPYRLERLGKGLLWNGALSSNTSLLFKPFTIADTWPAATSAIADNDYELIGPEVFRFEYSYILKGSKSPDASSSSTPSESSDTPWNKKQSGHTSVNGFRDVAAIVVTIAIIDSKSRRLVSEDQLKALANAMQDFAPGVQGSLAAQWQAAVDASSIPRAAASAIRIYSRSFSISPNFY